MSRIVILFVLLLVFDARAEVQIEEAGQRTTFQAKTASTAYEMRELRRMGVGAGVAGVYGITGVHLELNLNPKISPQIGFGLSTEFQTFHIQIKRIFGGESILPYLAVGYARWSNNGEQAGGIDKTNPGFVAEQFMSEEEKKKGIVDSHLIYPAAGVQYLVLNGPWAGVGVSAEVDVLVEVDSLEAAATGSIAGTYYF
ncbi:MAG: hypothetical protein KDD25_01360 [Bdellovibrionales bacterium]|nr:hypothetical protein [Bdellovibrionales bacterium]